MGQHRATLDTLAQAGACQAGPVRPSARGRRVAFQVITQGRHPVAVGQAAPAAGLLSEMERWKEPEPKPEIDQIIDKLRGCGMLRENSSSAQRQLVQREVLPSKSPETHLLRFAL